MRNTLLCTVGTSLFEGNLRRLSAETPGAPANHAEIKEYFDHENMPALAGALLKVDPQSRICGAEINTIEEATKKSWIELENLIFLVSDTQDGKNTGEVLKKYYEDRRDISLKQVDYRIIDSLQDKHPAKFKTEGLRNLVRHVGDYIGRFGIEQVAIDATGGYKAQIAVALLIGQALNIPVYYKHERFSEVIDFPPLPISLDYDMLGRNADVLIDFERGKDFSDEDLGHLDEKLKVFLTEVNIDGHSLFELNAIGQLYLTSFRLRYPKIPDLQALPEEAREVPSFGNDHHYPNGFKSFVEKIWAENKWIRKCISTNYNKQKGIKGIGFYVKEQGGDQFALMGTYKEKDFGARYQIELSDNSRASMNWAAEYLNRTYRP